MVVLQALPYAESARISRPAGSMATRSIPVLASEALAGVRMAAVIRPVSGSTAICAFNAASPVMPRSGQMGC
jgi:hypothetical protein